MSCSTCYSIHAKLITCESCDKKNCKNCIIKWINSNDNFCCPSCNSKWTDIFLLNSFSLNFLKNYHKSKTYKFAFETHYNNRGDSIDIVANIKYLSKKKIELYNAISKIKRNNSLYITPYVYIKRNILDEKKERKKFLLDHINQMEKLVALENELDYINAINPKYNTPKGIYIRICPNSKCHGMLNEELICKICNLELCKECHVKLIESHICKESDIESKLFFEKNSVSCPKCHTIILKVDDGGCDHMWCRKCKISFDWKTGIVILGKVSNPDRFRYERESITKKISEDSLEEKQKNFFTNFLENSSTSYFYREYDTIVEDIRINFLLQNLDLEQYKKQFILNYKRFYIAKQLILLYEKYLELESKDNFILDYINIYNTITFSWSEIKSPESIKKLDIF